MQRKLVFMHNKRLIGIVLTAAVILLIPLIAMQFTEDVKWTLLDFVVAGVLLIATGLVCEFAMRKVTKMAHRVAICVGVLATLLVIWAELAVGIIGTPFAGS